MDIPADVQAQIDTLMIEYESAPKTSIWMGYRSPRREVDSPEANLLLSRIDKLKAPYMDAAKPWQSEPKEGKARRVSVAVQRALKQEKEGRI